MPKSFGDLNLRSKVLVTGKRKVVSCPASKCNCREPLKDVLVVAAQREAMNRFKLNGVVLLKTSIEVKEMKATEKVAKHFSVYCTDEKLVKTLRSLSTQIEPRAREKCSSASSSVSVRDSIEQLASVVEGNKSSMENLVSKVEDLSRRHDSLNERYTEMSRENERSNREFSTQLTRVGFGCTTLRTDIQKANTKIKQHRVTTKEYI